MITVDGKKIASNLLKDLKKEAKGLGQKLNIAIISVSPDKASTSFIKKKKEVAEELGIGFKVFKFGANISNNELRKALNKITRYKKFNGVVVQLPLPEKLNCQYILDAVPCRKDIDVLSVKSLGRVYADKNKIISPVVAAVLKVVDQYDIKVKARHVVIIGAGRLVGKPILIEFIKHGATVTVLNQFTPSLKEHTIKADILISATGQPGIIKENMLKKGSVVFDIGMGTEKNKGVLRGDIDINGIEKKAEIFVPSSNGIGPIMVVMLMKNLIDLNKFN